MKTTKSLIDKALKENYLSENEKIFEVKKTRP